MSEFILNELTICGPAEEIKRFKDGLLYVDDECCLLESYVPLPKVLKGTLAQDVNIGYETFFNPDPRGYSGILELPEIKKYGIENREQLMEFVEREYPESIEDGQKINNNLFEFGHRDWYSWCNANWGTECDIFDIKRIETTTNDMRFVFYTIWMPPLNGLHQISRLFPDLDFFLIFVEASDDYHGFSHWLNGNWIDYELIYGQWLYCERKDNKWIEGKWTGHEWMGDGWTTLAIGTEYSEYRPEDPEEMTLERMTGGISVFAKQSL
jgi:hypothetical protein